MGVLKCIVISDFNVSNLENFIADPSASPKLTCIPAPFNQVTQVLTSPTLPCWEDKPDFAFVWCRPELLLPSLSNVIQNYPESPELPAQIDQEMDQFVELLVRLRNRVKFTFVASLSLDPARFFGFSSFRRSTGIHCLLMKMNLKLADKLNHLEGFYLLDSLQWMAQAGPSALRPKLDYLSKTPFHPAVFRAAAAEISSAVRGILGLSKKLLVTDLDDTLWGGIAGDVGTENLNIGGHDAEGEAFADFQRELKSLSRKGILLGIVSKNDEETAIDALENHPEMVLKKGDFAGWKINWNDKAQNIVDLVNELRLGLDSVVYIDDNPAERARVREALPSVFVPEIPADKLLVPSFIRNLDCFNVPVVSREDSNRQRYYEDEKSRSESAHSFSSVEEWLKSIHIRMHVEKVSANNILRVAQLFNKTNQVNLSTRRMSGQEILDWIARGQNRMWAFTMSDRFGDAGLTGVAGITVSQERASVSDFILSCRVMGRKAEEKIVGFLIRQAASLGCKQLSAEYVPSGKNKPCLDFLNRSGLSSEGNIFFWNTSRAYPEPGYIQLSEN